MKGSLGMVGSCFVMLFALSHDPVLTAQVDEASARNIALVSIRSGLDLQSDDFLKLWRDEQLEQELAEVARRQQVPLLVFKASQTGIEFKDGIMTNHVHTDGYDISTIAVNTSTGNAYRIQGYKYSSTEFRKMMLSIGLKIQHVSQVAMLGIVYREINPDHLYDVGVPGLLELKQDAENRCAPELRPRDVRRFERWWKNAHAAYQGKSFKEVDTSDGNSFSAEWVIFAAGGLHDSCAGKPVRIRLRICGDGNISLPEFSPL